MSGTRKWSKFTVSDADLVRTLDIWSRRGWEMFSVVKDPELTAYSRYIVIAYLADGEEHISGQVDR